MNRILSFLTAAFCSGALSTQASAQEADELALSVGAWAYVAGLPTTATVRPIGRFDADLTQFTGNAGCNSFSASFSQNDEEGEAVEFRLGLMTARACAPDIMRAERLFLDALDSTVRYAATPSTLILIDADGRVTMVLERVVD